MSAPPPFSLLLRHPAHLIACGLGAGLAPFAPGTFGTLFAWLSYPLLRSMMPDDAGFAWLLVLLFVLGIPACQIAGHALGEHDHGSIVWDEIVSFWTVLFMTPNDFLWQLTAFGIFRLFDIVKLPPARFFDRQWPNGFGVMIDDLVAASYAVFVLALLKPLGEVFF